MAITLPVAVVIFAVFVASVHGNTCDACDECSLSNVEILHDLIDARISDTAATQAEEFTAALGEQFTAIVDDRISTVSTTLSALNATVNERLTTVTTTLGEHDASIAKLLSQQGPGKLRCMQASCTAWVLCYHIATKVYR